MSKKLPQFEELKGEGDLDVGLLVPEVTPDSELSLFLKRSENGKVVVALLDFRERFEEVVSAGPVADLFYERIDVFARGEVVGLVCDDVLQVSGLSEVPHRNIKLIPALRGTGLSTYMYDLSNRVGGVLGSEIAIRLDHAKLLLKAGFIPKTLHFTPRPDLGSSMVEKFDLDPAMARKMILLLKSFNRENDFLEAKFRFITEFVHQSEIDETDFMDQFENVSVLSDFHLDSLAQLLIDWDVLIIQSENLPPEKVIASIREYIDRFKRLLKH